jgi:hypothetical protein
MLVRVAASGLLKPYLRFAMWAAASFIKSAWLLIVAIRFGYGSPQYVSAWQPLQWIGLVFLLGVGYEAYQLTAQNYPSLGSYGRRTLLQAVLIALAISAAPFWLNNALWHNMTWIVSVLIRTATLTVGVGLVIAVRRLRFVPISEQNNLKNHRRLIVLYCAGQAVGLGMLVLTKDLVWVSMHLLVTAVCWLTWPFALTKAGETLQRRTYTSAEKVNMRRRLRDIRRWLELAVASQRVRPSEVPLLSHESNQLRDRAPR